ncbi:hypothetical protein Tco_0813553 [Tanacetum coccineum]
MILSATNQEQQPVRNLTTHRHRLRNSTTPNDSQKQINTTGTLISVDNEMASFLALERVGFGTNSLLEQWKDTYENDDYDYDPYDDDMYDGQEIPNKVQSTCDNLDIKLWGRKKK